MPILTLKVVQPEGAPVLSGQQVQALADELGIVFGSPPARTWIQVEYLSANQYAENETVLLADHHPIFVDVLKVGEAQREDRARAARQISRVIADITERPASSVHILYLPPGQGRVAFGGELS